MAGRFRVMQIEIRRRVPLVFAAEAKLYPCENVADLCLLKNRIFRFGHVSLVMVVESTRKLTDISPCHKKNRNPGRAAAFFK